MNYGFLMLNPIFLALKNNATIINSSLVTPGIQSCEKSERLGVLQIKKQTARYLDVIIHFKGA